MYGPHDKYDLERSHVFGATVTKVMTNEDGVINVWGTGEGARDLLYIWMIWLLLLTQLLKDKKHLTSF